MSATEETLGLLRSIDATLKTLLALSQRRTPAAAKEIASDRELDSQYGDPVVKLVPRDWSGDSFKGARMSQCPAEYLDLLAEMFDYFADKAERNNDLTTSGKPKAPYNRKDAARARGWAKRARNGPRAAMTQAQVPSEPATDVSEWAAPVEEAGDPWNVNVDEVFARR